MLKQRKGNEQKNNYYSIKSIVWNYYILGKKTFKQLTK